MVAIIPANSTGPKIDERVRNHKEKLRKWQETTRSTNQALQQQLIALFGEEYLRRHQPPSKHSQKNKGNGKKGHIKNTQ